MLNFVTYGQETAPRLLIAHGLFGSARNWGVIAKRLSDQFHVIVVDMRNHGDSPRAAGQSYPEMAGDLAQVLDHLGPSALLGHSMGGKAAMVLALSKPQLVTRLIVGDIAPVGYAHTQGHLITAMRAIDLDKITSRQDADQILARYEEDAGVRAFLLQSLDLRAKSWKLNHDELAKDMDKIIGFPAVTGSFDRPTLFLTGALSDYVQPAHRPIIKAHFPKARFAKLPEAGHWLHAERPREFEAAVRVFLDQPEDL